jgi:Cu(I)/Ag(I) efflux system membrane protein CusA/SilA
MVAYIIEYSARNRLIVFLLVFGLALGGVWAVRNTPVDASPISRIRRLLSTPPGWDALPVWLRTKSPIRL